MGLSLVVALYHQEMDMLLLSSIWLVETDTHYIDGFRKRFI